MTTPIVFMVLTSNYSLGFGRKETVSVPLCDTRDGNHQKGKIRCLEAGMVLGDLLIGLVLNPTLGICGAVVVGTHVDPGRLSGWHAAPDCMVQRRV
jgi:hypothetical protein